MVKELNFTTKNGGLSYEAEAVISADFNIQLSRMEPGSVTLYLSCYEDMDGGEEFKQQSLPKDWGRDFDGIVYPKYMRIVSSSFVKKGRVKEVED